MEAAAMVIAIKSRFSYLSYSHPFLVGVLNQHMSNLCCIVKISQRNNKTRPQIGAGNNLKLDH